MASGYYGPTIIYDLVYLYRILNYHMSIHKMTDFERIFIKIKHYDKEIL